MIPYLDTGIKIHVTEFGIILGEITGEYRSGKLGRERSWRSILCKPWPPPTATRRSGSSTSGPTTRNSPATLLFAEDGEPNASIARSKACFTTNSRLGLPEERTKQAGTQISRVSRDLRCFAPAAFRSAGFRADCPGQQLDRLQGNLERANGDAACGACARNVTVGGPRCRRPSDQSACAMPPWTVRVI
jgi:hypothetical protein